MPKRRSAAERVIENFVVDHADEIGSTLLDGLAGFVGRMGQQQRSTMPAEYLAQPFRCIVCKNQFPNAAAMEMIHPSNGWGSCKGCLGLMWGALGEKMAAIRAARSQGAPSGAGAPPPPQQGQPPGRRRPPYEVLGVTTDASVDDIKKAYRKLALDNHPDRVPEGASFEEKQTAAARFREITTAYDAMMKVRQAAK